MTDDYRRAARELTRDPYRLAGYIASVADVTDDRAIALLVDTATAATRHNVTTVGGLARYYLGYNRRTLNRQFRAYGLPRPSDVLMLVRLAVLWLTVQGYGVSCKAAALACGFPDPFTPSVAMHRMTGLRPSAAKRGEHVAALIGRWANQYMGARPAGAA